MTTRPASHPEITKLRPLAQDYVAAIGTGRQTNAMGRLLLAACNGLAVDRVLEEVLFDFHEDGVDVDAEAVFGPVRPIIS